MRHFSYLLALILSVGILWKVDAQTVVAQQDFDNPINLVNTTATPTLNSFSSPADAFGIFQRGMGSIAFDLLDDSACGFASDAIGIVKCNKTDAFFGVADLENGDNEGGTGEVVFTFNINNAGNMTFSVDLAAMGDFESSDTYSFSYSIDGGAELPLLNVFPNEDINQTYTLEDGDMFTLNDPQTVDGTLLNNNFQTFTKSISGTGAQLEIIFRAQQNAGGEPFAFDNIVIKGDVDGGGPGEGGCDELFISEVVEGSSNNKAVEVYNPTMSSVDLAAGGYNIAAYNNGNSDLNNPTTNVNLSGTIASGDVFVLAEDSAFPELLALADQTQNLGWFNGNDVIVLWKGGVGGTIVDVIGQLGNSANFNQNITIRRNSNVTSGDTNPDDAFSTATEFTSLAQNDISGIGFHMSDCIMTPCMITGITVNNISDCNDNETISTSDDTFTADVTVDFMGAPEGGTLELMGDATASMMVSNIEGNSFTFVGVTFPSDGGTIALTAMFSDVPSCSFTNSNAGTAPSACSVIPPCSRPFFSEYIEGSGLNKCVEIYNPTDSDIDLAAGGFAVKVFFNGSSSAGTTINLSGILASGEVFVVCDDGADDEILALADQTTTSSLWNGDDAVVLESSEGILDVIGQIGFDPGSRFGSGDVTTQNNTLRRFAFVLAGDNVGTDAFDPAFEWDGRPSNNFDNLGFHATECQPSPVPAGLTPNFIGCGDGSVSEDNGVFTLESNCFDPNPGSDDLTFVNAELCGDGYIVARVTNLSSTGYAGVMFRESASKFSKYAWLTFRGANTFRAYTQVRANTGGAPQTRLRMRQGRQWMKLERTGDFFRFYISANGSQWILIDQIFVDMADCMLAGFAIHSVVDFTNATVTFDNFSVVSGQNGIGLAADESIEEGQVDLDRGGQGGLHDNSLELAELTETAAEGLNVYPNPATDHLTVQLDNWIENEALISITDLNGAVLYYDRFERNGNTVELDLTTMNLAPGMYLLNVATENEIKTERFVKATR